MKLEGLSVQFKVNVREWKWRKGDLPVTWMLLPVPLMATTTKQLRALAFAMKNAGLTAAEAEGELEKLRELWVSRGT